MTELILSIGISLLFFGGVVTLYLKDDETKKNKWIYFYLLISALLIIGLAIMLCVFYKQNLLIHNLKRLLLVDVLLIVALTDWVDMRIPNKYVLAGLIGWIALTMANVVTASHFPKGIVVDELIAGSAMFLVGMLCRITIKNSIGAGDVKLFFVIGLMLGLSGTWSAVFASLIISFFVSLYLLIFKKKNRKDVIPFGPALAIGTTISIFMTGM